MQSYDLIVVGSGLAGLHAALFAAEFGDVLLVTKARLEDCNTMYAQGGIAAALAGPDSPTLHFHDTIAAGDGLCDREAVRILVEEGPPRVRELIALGVPFDRIDGEILATREAAHSLPRILHAGGDATGARIETTIVESVKSSRRITVRENCAVTKLRVRDGRVVGIRALDGESGQSIEFAGGAVLLATGGAGQLFEHTTNPVVATGDGIALAFQAGAVLTDLEFVQFHPTALLVAGAPRFLISEAVRGEGGILRNRAGERFVPTYDARGELAPRDVVARAIAFEMQRTGDACAYLDVSRLGADYFRRRFPTISRVCTEFGIELAVDPIPVSPAAHYVMGGILTDAWGQTTVPGLFAAGECACTGVHGANRLASNSLLEALVFSDRVVRKHFNQTGGDNGLANESLLPSTKAAVSPGTSVLALRAPRRIEIYQPKDVVPITPTATEIRHHMWNHAGLVRDADGLSLLLARSDGWVAALSASSASESLELTSLATLARLVATAASYRTESRGAHFRTDYPVSDDRWRRRTLLSSGHGASQPKSLSGRRNSRRSGSELSVLASASSS